MKEKINQMDTDLKSSNKAKEDLQELVTKLEKQVTSLSNEREKLKNKI
jgi:hypothetical protein